MQQDHGRDEALAEFKARAGSSKFVTLRNVLELLEAAAPPIKEAIANATKPLQERVDKLERRLVEIEAKGISYQGVFQKAQQYSRGSMVTHDGSLHAAIRDTLPGEMPGDASGAFQLCCKKGRDGRDVR